LVYDTNTEQKIYVLREIERAQIVFGMGPFWVIAIHRVFASDSAAVRNSNKQESGSRGERVLI